MRLQGCEPRSLLPAAVDRFCGMEVARALYTPLTEEGDAGEPPRWGEEADHAVARSISSEDAVTWRIELDPDWVFHDGQPVRAEHFVDAWNFAAYGPNAQPLSFLFEPIEGFADVNCPEPGCEPEADELAGVREVDELTIEVELRRPDRFLPHRLAHVAFAPLPPQALEDPEGFAEAPIGNGPLRIEGTWRHNEGLSLRLHEDYRGVPARATAVEVVLFSERRDAWEALERGDIDVATGVPPTVRERARSRYATEVADGDRLDLLVVPAYRVDLHDDVVEALSRAIDRQAIIDGHLAGLARPAKGLVPPVVSNDDDRCPQLCAFDPAAARAALEQSELPGPRLELWIDRDAGHPAWSRAIVEQWRTHLGLGADQVRLRSLSHTSWVSHLQDRRVGGLHPLGWTMDVASPLPYLEELHVPGGLFNFDGFDDPVATAAVARSRAAPSDAVATAAWRDAERSLLDGRRAVPLWVRQHEAYFVDDIVADVRLDPRGGLRLGELSVRDP